MSLLITAVLSVMMFGFGIMCAMVLMVAATAKKTVVLDWFIVHFGLFGFLFGLSYCNWKLLLMFIGAFLAQSIYYILGRQK